MEQDQDKFRRQNRDMVIIRKTNDLIEARYKMTMWEVRVWDKFLSLLRHEREIKDEYRVEIGEIIRNYRLEGDKRAFQRIIEAAHSLQDRYITDSAISRDEMRHLRSHVFASIEIVVTRDGGSYMLFEVPKKLKPILTANRERYKDFLLENFIGMSSFYSKRVYEILKQYELIGHRTITLDDLRNVLAIGAEEYKLYGHFKKRVVEKAQEDCARCSDIRFEIEEIKKGRAVHAIRFLIRSNKPLRITEPEAVTNRLPKLPFSMPKSAAFSPVFFEKKAVERGGETAAPPPLNPLFHEFFVRLNEWWGVEDDELLKRLDGKTASEIESAIAFTKERIKIGKAFNPAGVFLDALSKGHRSPAQVREQRAADQKKREAERKTQIKSLSETYENLLDQYSAGVNEIVRAITSEHPEVTETVVEELRAAQRMLGNRKIDSYTIDDFRRDPMLRSMVIAGIMSRHSALFDGLRAELGGQIEAIKRQILSIEPAFRFG